MKIKALEDKFYNFLYNIFPKRTEIVNNIAIHYLKLPFFLVASEKDGHFCLKPKGMVLVRTRDKKIMIFISGDSCYQRYTLFHEYWEGKVIASGKTTEAILKSVLEIVSMLNFHIPSKDRFERWIRFHGPHAEALFEELKMAQHEMSARDFAVFFDDAMKNRT